MKTAFDRACDAVGGRSELARLIGKAKQTVNHYRRRVPLHMCPLIEAATGVSRQELRPDFEWGMPQPKKPGRKQKAVEV